jgi:hypothetical protein
MKEHAELQPPTILLSIESDDDALRFSQQQPLACGQAGNCEHVAPPDKKLKPAQSPSATHANAHACASAATSVRSARGCAGRSPPALSSKLYAQGG